MRLYSNWKFAGINRGKKKSARFIKVKQNCKHVRKTLAIICSSLLGLVLSFTRTDRYMLVFMEISYSIKTQVQVLHLKFIYSEKTTKFCEFFPLLLTVCTVVNSKGKILQNFVAFSEYMNLQKWKIINVMEKWKMLRFNCD